MIYLIMKSSLLLLIFKFKYALKAPKIARRSLTKFSTSSVEPNIGTSDLLLSGLNADQDISVKIVSCRELIQESIIKQDLSTQAAIALGELMTCTLLMGAGLKDDETLQINLVGDRGLGNVMAITDGNLKARGTIKNRNFQASYNGVLKMRDMLGEGQIQVVRSHPTWKFPTNGIVALRDIKIPLNLALYLAESEQRTSVLLTDVYVEGNLCRHSLGVLLERLPGANEFNIEASIRNLEAVERKGLRSYLNITPEDKWINGEFRSFEPVLGKILDDVLGEMGEDFRATKTPKFRCSCGVDRVWRMLAMLPKDDIKYIIDNQETVEVRTLNSYAHIILPLI